MLTTPVGGSFGSGPPALTHTYQQSHAIAVGISRLVTYITPCHATVFAVAETHFTITAVHILSPLSHRTGRSFQLEPSFKEYGRSNPNKLRAQADVRAFLPRLYGITLLDISVTPPLCCVPYVQPALQQRSATAARQDRDQSSGIEGHSLGSQTYFPASVETYGCWASPFCNAFHMPW
jgi:hypothetical protein